MIPFENQLSIWK